MQKGIYVLLWLLGIFLLRGIWPVGEGWATPLLRPNDLHGLLEQYQRPFLPLPGPPLRSGLVPKLGRLLAAPSGAARLAPKAPKRDTWPGFLHRLKQLKDGEIQQLRVLHLGDSELFADGTSGGVRKQLQRDYGNAGLGFAAPARPLPWYIRDGWTHRKGMGFSSYPMTQGKQLGGFFGPAGIAYEGAPGARARVAMQHPGEVPCQVEFYFAYIPRGGKLTVRASGRAVGRVDTDRWKKGLGVWRRRFVSCPAQLEVHVTGRHAIVYGWNVGYEQPGIVWSCMGVLSAQLAHFKNYDRKHLASSLSALHPDLLVLTYGLNQAALEWLPGPAYGEAAVAAFRILRKAAPDAACLVTSPYPVGYPKRNGGFNPEALASAKVGKYLKHAAQQVGCAFLDRYQLAGGIKAARRWVRAYPRILGGDFQHLTAHGAALMGQRLAETIRASDGALELGQGLDFALENMR